MLCLARWMSRSAFGIGMAIGILVSPGVLHATYVQPGGGVSYDAGPVETEQKPVPVCPEAAFLADPEGEDAKEWCEFVSFGREVWSAVVGGTGDAPLYYRTFVPVTGNGLFTAVDADGTAITVQVLASATLDKSIPMGERDASAVVWATLKGPTGSANVEALLWTQVIETGHLVSHITPIERMLPEMEQWLTQGGGFAARALANGQQANCLAQAAAAFAAVMAIYAAAYAACKAGVTRALIAALARCAAFLLVPVLGKVKAALCAALVIAVAARARRACGHILTEGAKNAALAAAAAYAACIAGAVVPVNQAAGVKALAEQ